MATKRPGTGGTINPGPLLSRKRPPVETRTATADREKSVTPRSQNPKGSRIYGPASGR